VNPTKLQSGVRYRLPERTKRGRCPWPVARFARRIWSAPQNEHWYLFVAGTGREVWLAREDIAGCEVEGSER